MEFNIFPPEDFLLNINQGGRPLEGYVEEFVGVCDRVSWSHPMLDCIFLSGLDEDLLVLIMLTNADEYPLEDFFNRVL